jgi:crotonobetainyl-CoA:carnitine CoA-transferase CaiB-like acyl-CoA transferase
MSDAAMTLTTLFGSNALASGNNPDYGNEMLNGGLFYDYYETLDHRHLAIGSLEPNFAFALLTLLELDHLANNLADQSPQMQNIIRSAISAKISSLPLSHWEQTFKTIDACVEPVLTMNEAFKHPHFIAREMITQAIDDDNNTIQQINSALPFKRETPHKAGKALGADTLNIMQSLGYDHEQIAVLKATQCI